MPTTWLVPWKEIPRCRETGVKWYWRLSWKIPVWEKVKNISVRNSWRMNMVNRSKTSWDSGCSLMCWWCIRITVRWLLTQKYRLRHTQAMWLVRMPCNVNSTWKHTWLLWKPTLMSWAERIIPATMCLHWILWWCLCRTSRLICWPCRPIRTSGIMLTRRRSYWLVRPTWLQRFDWPWIYGRGSIRWKIFRTSSSEERCFMRNW